MRTIRTTRARTRRARAGLAALAVAVLGLAGCASAPQVSVAPSSGAPSTAASPSPTASPVTCSNATVSYAPSTTSAYADQIRARGFLVVGVSADTTLLGAVVPRDPQRFEGFDIDLATRVAEALWPGQGAQRLRFKVISAAQRVPQLTTAVTADNVSAGGVDLVARAFTMTCSRWQQVNFSAVYLQATQKLLVPAGEAVTGIDALAKGSKVCAPTGSTSLDELKNHPNVTPVAVAAHTDCLTLLQQGQVQAITGDDVILAGFRAQDPNTTVLPAAFGQAQPYGLGIPKDHPDFAAYVNGVLEKARADGSWQKAYDRWLRGPLGVAGVQPTPQYGRGTS